MKIVVSSIVDINNVANNRVHYFLERLCTDHEIDVICPKDTWRESQTDTASYGRMSDVLDENVTVHYLLDEKSTVFGSIPPTLQESCADLLSRRLNLDFKSYDLHIDYNTLFLGRTVDSQVGKSTPSVYDLADDLSAMVRESPQIPYPMNRVGATVADQLISHKCRNFEKTFYITDELRQTVGLKESKAVHLANGVDTDLFSPQAEVTGISAPDTDLIVGYVGVNREWVDLSAVVQSISTLRKEGFDVGLLVVGEEGGLTDLKRESARLGVSPFCVFPGTVPYEEVPLYVNTMDIGTIPFKPGNISKGALPLKLFEYMACEKPVISSQIPGVKNAAGDLVRFANEDWETELRVLLENRELRENLGQQGRTLVEQNYSWDAITCSLEESLREVTRTT